jgi:SAM domain (Sterile alpha motif)
LWSGAYASGSTRRHSNEIDETVLPSLTHETLKELGVTAVGHRLKLLDVSTADDVPNFGLRGTNEAS